MEKKKKDDGKETKLDTKQKGLETDPKPKTYSEEELQSEVDRRVNQAVKTAGEKALLEKTEAIEAEKARLEKLRLEEEGKFKELHEKSDIELRMLKEKVEMAERRSAAMDALKKSGVEEAGEVLLEEKGSTEDYVSAGEKLKAIIEAKVQTAVEARLQSTGKAAAGDGIEIEGKTKHSDFRTAAEKTAYIKKYGIDKWTKLVSERGAATPA